MACSGSQHAKATSDSWWSRSSSSRLWRTSCRRLAMQNVRKMMLYRTRVPFASPHVSQTRRSVLVDARFQDTGLERSAALAKDIDWFDHTYGLKAPQVAEDGPGQTYARQATQHFESVSRDQQSVTDGCTCPVRPLVDNTNLLDATLCVDRSCLPGAGYCGSSLLKIRRLLCATSTTCILHIQRAVA